MHFGDELELNPTMFSPEAQVGTDNLLDQSCYTCLFFVRQYGNFPKIKATTLSIEKNVDTT